MAKRVAKFEKVSEKRFVQDFKQLNKYVDDDRVKEIYNSIKLPKRATKFSAGYDFYTPTNFMLRPGETINIPTGIRCGMNTDWVLMIYPRSGLGFKYGINLMNQTAVVDADYYYSNNEGHIFLKLVNRGDKTVTIKCNDKIAQGVFLPYGITEDDHVETCRNGGFGSTDKKG